MNHTQPATNAPIAQAQLVDVLIKLPEVSRQIGLGKTAIYAMMKLHTFPHPIKYGRESRWSQLEVQAWIEERKKERVAA